MFDQTFSSRNFREIFDSENRKGRYLEGRFFPKVEEYSIKLTRIRQAFRRLKQRKPQLSEVTYQSRKQRLNLLKDDYLERRESLLSAELEEVARKVNMKGFCFELRKSTSHGASPVYVMDNAAETYFANKKLQYNLKGVYGVCQADKEQIIPQLQNLLKDGFPKYIIRTDVKSFYESIDQEKLSALLNKEQALTATSRRMIAQILREYAYLSSSSHGIPRGIGVSPYLAELYMQEFDAKIKEHPDVVYYARYVDDIIIIFCPSPNSNLTDYNPFVSKRLSEITLEMNSKTRLIDLTSPGTAKLTYLGYTFRVSPGGLEVHISCERIKRYRARIDAAFNSYLKKSKSDKNKERRLLIARIRFLTGNTRLLNNKSSAMVGVFYSNKFAEGARFLPIIDSMLVKRINSLTDITLKRRLSKLSFEEGFYKKVFRSFSTMELRAITAAWTHE